LLYASAAGVPVFHLLNSFNLFLASSYGFISTIRKQNQNPFQNLKFVFEKQFQWADAK